MDRLHVLVPALLLVGGCASVSGYVRDGDLGGACSLLEPGTPEDRALFASAVDDGSAITYQLRPVTEAELEARVGVPARIGDVVPFLVAVQVQEVPRAAWYVRMAPPVLSVGAVEHRLGWPSYPVESIPAEALALFPPPPVPDEVPVPEPYERQSYAPTPRPRVERVGGGSGGNALESAVTGFLSTLTLGLAEHRGGGSPSTLTPASQRALRRWHQENAGARAAFEAEEERRYQERRAAIHEAREHNATREDGLREWRRSRRTYPLQSWLSPSCDFDAREVAEMAPADGTCEWLVLLPRGERGRVLATVETSVVVKRFRDCTRTTRHELASEGEGELVESLGRLFAAPRSLSEMRLVDGDLRVE